MLTEPLDRAAHALARAATAEGLIPAGRMASGGLVRLIPPLGGGVAFGFFEGVSYTGSGLLSGRTARRILARHRPAPEVEFFGLLDFALASGAEL